MNDLAESYLRQARSFMIAGEPNRSIDLLKKARALASNQPDILVAVLSDLCSACKLAGRFEEAGRFREQLMALSPKPEPQIAVARRPKRLLSTRKILLAAIACLMIGISGGIFWMIASLRNQSNGETISNPGVPDQEPRNLSSREKLLFDDVGLVVVMLEYSGNINGTQMQVDVPWVTGSCFAVGSDGCLLTNRHVVDPDYGGWSPPASLSSITAFKDCPDMSLVRTYNLVCFGRNESDHLAAEVQHTSQKIDMAILHVDRKFARPMEFAGEMPHAMDNIYAWGYPGVVGDFFNNVNADSNQIRQQMEAAISRGQINFFDLLYNAESFTPQSNEGSVSVARRLMQGVTFVQFDATIAHGNSGGPLVDSKNQIVGMVTEGLVNTQSRNFEGQNFALSGAELENEYKLLLNAP